MTQDGNFCHLKNMANDMFFMLLFVSLYSTQQIVFLELQVEDVTCFDLCYDQQITSSNKFYRH